MSKETPNPQQSEEVDLGQLFKLIGNAFDRFLNFIGSIFKSVFSVFIYAIKAIIVNFKIIALTVIVAFVLGFVLERFQPKTYKSQMIVKPYFDSKYQLITNINYYNALIQEQDYNQLKELFDIDVKSAEQLMEFEVVSAPESENDRIIEYNNFLISLDSSNAAKPTYNEFVENRSLYSGDVFQIDVVSTQKDIFRALEKGLNKTFVNTYSSKKMQKRDTLIALSKARITSSLQQVDSLKRVYIQVLQNESNSKNQGPVSFKDGMSMVQERVKTKEFELLEKELDLKEELNNLDSQKVEEDVFFDTLASFQDVGEKYKCIWSRYSIIFPILSVFLLVLGYLLQKVVVFSKNYE